MGLKYFMSFLVVLAIVSYLKTETMNVYIYKPIEMEVMRKQ